MHQHKTIEDTVYFWFGANDTSGSGNDGATAVFDVRLAGAAAGAAPVLSGSPTLLSHANYPAGCYEVAVAATVVNGFAADATYAVFCTLLVDSQNPTGFVGSFTLTPLATSAQAVSILAYSASAAAWGSINSGIVFRGVVSAAVPGVSFTIGGLAGQGVGAFIDANTPWYAYVFRDAGGAAAAPQGETKQITGYTSATGLFTTEAFTVPVAVGDDVIITSGRIAAIPEILTDTNKIAAAFEEV